MRTKSKSLMVSTPIWAWLMQKFPWLEMVLMCTLKIIFYTIWQPLVYCNPVTTLSEGYWQPYRFHYSLSISRLALFLPKSVEYEVRARGYKWRHSNTSINKYFSWAHAGKNSEEGENLVKTVAAIIDSLNLGKGGGTAVPDPSFRDSKPSMKPSRS